MRGIRGDGLTSNMETSNTKSADLEAVVTNTIKDISQPLLDVIGIISNAIVTSGKGGKFTATNKMSKDDMFALAIKIPVECVFIQSVINQYNTGVALGAIFTGNAVTEKITELYGERGDAKERLRRAELFEAESILTVEMKKQVARGLQAVVERADKVYEGIKKVLDAASKEAWLDNKIK
jgi:hypothetical protein